MPEKLKIVLIGAASPQWGHKISRDLILVLSDERILDSYNPVLVLEDIDKSHLEKQHQLAKKVAEKIGGKVTIESTTDQQRAIEGARFVLTSFAVGSLEAMQHDLEIPLEYEIFQPVGDTISIGGAIRAARNIPTMLQIAQDIEQVGDERAWLLNLSNPMSMLCRAVTRETKVKTIGCCHELYNGLKFLSKCLDFPYSQWKERLKFDVLGINHCGWIQHLKIEGEDGFEKFRNFLATNNIMQETKKLYDSPHPELTRHNVKINLFLKYGLFPFSADRHTAEFFSEFINTKMNKGADFGVLLTTLQERLVSWRGKARSHINELLAGKREIDLTISEEAAPRIIAAFLTGEPFYDIGNLPYSGDALPGIPDGMVLETMVTYRNDQAVPSKIKSLPDKIHNHLVLHTQIIEDIVTACIDGDKKLFIQALERDPLLQNMNPRKIDEMVERLFFENREYKNIAST